LASIIALQNMLAQGGKKMRSFKEKGDLNCFYKNKYSAIQRNQFYPFSISDEIKIASFHFHRLNYPIKGDTLINDSLVEIKTLNKFEVDSLSDILYNNFYKSTPNYGVITQCYAPRNCILFFRKGVLKEYIFIRFHGDRHKESSDKVKFGHQCSQKIVKLDSFFIQMGLKYGTDKSKIDYPDENPSEPPVSELKRNHP
jgi:hypothetical protein